MKKRLLFLMMALALYLGLTVSVSATDLEDNYEIFDVIGPDYVIRGSEGGGSVLASHSGVKDKAGNVVIPADYIALEFLGHSNALIARKHIGETGYADGIIDINQNVLVPFQYKLIQKDMWSGESSKYLLMQDAKTCFDGILGPDFSITVPAKYNGVDLLSEEDGYFLVGSPDGIEPGYYPHAWHLRSTAGENRGVCDKNGKLIIPCEFDLIDYLGEGYFAVNKNGVEGVYDSQGKVVIPLEYAGYKLPEHAAYQSSNNTGIRRGRDAFVVRKFVSEEYRQRAAAGESPPNDGEPWTTAGIVDFNNNVLLDFGKYHGIYFPEGSDSFICSRWTGEYVPDSVQIVGGSTHYVKEYETDYIPYDSLNVPAPPKPVNVGGFTDVKSNDYFADAVLWAVEHKITSGASATMFSPSTTCNRAQILTFLWRANGSPEPTAANPFTDIKSTDFYYKAALWAAEKGLVSGSTFGDGTDCTRAMTVEYLWKAAGRPTAAKQASFNDVPASADYAQAVAWAVEKGITSGTGGGNFSPNTTCTRGQIAAFLYRAMGS